MHLRAKLACTVGVLVVAALGLSACGSEQYATDRYNVIANGGYSLTGPVRVEGAQVVASANDTGIFVATLILDPTISGATMAEQTPAKYAMTTLASADQSAASHIDDVSGLDVKVEQTGMINLSTATSGGVPVTGTFTAGDMLPLTLSFANGYKVTVQTPVVANCGYVAGAGQPGGSTPLVTATAEPSVDATGQPGPYDCAQASLPPLGE
jgi:hypothetical protein